MRPRTHLPLFVLFLVAMLISPAPAQPTDTDPEITITDFKDGITGYRYIWKVPASHLEALPRWNPTETEVPLSPRKAAQIATAYLLSAFPAKTKVTIYSLNLDKPNGPWENAKPELQSVWVYHISFSATPEPSDKDKALLEVLVLLDGTVVKPDVTALK